MTEDTQSQEVESVIIDGVSVSADELSDMGRLYLARMKRINQKREIAIVTEDQGTTRDVIELSIDYKGFPIIFSDTAGIRKSKIKAERIGVKKTIEVAKKADLNLVFIDKYNEIKTYNEIQKKIYVQSKIVINKKIKGK